ncbi:hypothetical protein N7520_001996 [Penicillium odoratum]|uniref:uncharacterized protein n=1 Tax=Penicillium odoratum TaxID=1167516 RepID=UPI002548677F|nr:uncharacterized protein N7520_001996 [Penicillium odoratum]KAJ5778750.1 hypothetical protein N7520_001996 [Penicillium odoratum]
MSVATKSPPQPATQDVILSSPKSDSLKSFLKCVIELATSPELQATTTIMCEFDHQKQQIKQLNDLGKDHMITIKTMAATIQNEKKAHEDTQAQLERLKKEMADKDRVIADQLQKINALGKDAKNLRSEKSQETMRATRLSDENTLLQRALKEKDAIIEKNSASETALDERLKSEKKRSEKLSEDYASLERMMTEFQVKLQQTESFRAPYSEMDIELMTDQFANLWDYATQQISKVLNQDILIDHISWETFRKGSTFMMPHTVPLPASTSKAAKGMRLVITLAILSREIEKHIFQPNYLDSDDNQLRRVLSELATTNGEKESFCRAMLLSIDETVQRRSALSRVSRIARDVTHHLFGTLSDIKQEELRQTMSKIAEEAMNVWIPLQHAEIKYEPDFEPLLWDDDEWACFEFPGEKTANAKRDAGSPTELLTIFPRISQVAEKKRHGWTFVTQIRSSHHLWSLAEQEVNRSPSSPVTRMPSTGTRRPSISATARPNGILNGKTSPDGKPSYRKENGAQ